MPETETISEAFDCIRLYAEREGWIPIGFRTFTVGPWTVTVNGTNAERDHVLPYHALVAHKDIVSFLMLNPFHGTIGGWSEGEDRFIADMRAELG